MQHLAVIGRFHTLARLFAPADGGGDGDSGEFVSESASTAFDIAPDDTTVHLDAEQPPVVEEATIDEPPPGADETSEESRSGASAPAAVAETGKGGKKKQPSGRVAELKREIDTLTHTKHKTAADLAADERRLTTLRTEIAELEKKRGTVAAPDAKPAEAAAAAAAVAAGEEPEHPNYRDFDTDEDYEKARVEWKKSHGAWNERRLEALKSDLTKGIEAQFSNRDMSAAARQSEQRMVAVLTEVSASKPDWNERRESMKGLTSAWYDPKVHGEAQTPFLSDLSQSLMLQGRKEGAELLYWLGEDPDRAQRLADLLPTRQVRDAILHAPSVQPLLEYFATDEGAQQFEALKQMHPVRMMQSIGALSARLTPVPSGSGAASHSITKALPSARPPAGTPGARGTDAAGTTAKPTGKFDDWMAQEDEREHQEKLRSAGLAR